MTGRCIFPGTPVSSTNKTDRHDITEIVLKVALNTIKPNQTIIIYLLSFFFLGNIHSSLLEIDVNKENVFDEAKTKWPTDFWTQYKNLTLRSFKLSAVKILDKVKLIENILICLIVSVIWFQLPRSEETLSDRMGAVSIQRDRRLGLR